jgi:lysophospholipase L1-like esterase
MRKFVFYSLYLFFSTLILLEISVRLWGYSNRHIYDPIYMHYLSPEIPYILKPNLRNAKAPTNTIINTDEMGLRCLNPCSHHEKKEPGEYRIIFLGDSFTFGQGVNNAELFTQVIEDDLNQRQSQYKVDIFNFAVSGYNVKTMVDTLRYRALSLKPNLVVMCIIYDDFNLNRTGLVDESGYTVNKYGSNHSLIWNKIKRIARNIHLVYVIRDFFMTSPPPLSEKTDEIPDSYRYLLEIWQLAKDHNIPYLIVTLPAKHSSDMQILKIEKQMTKDNLNFYDLYSLTASFNIQDFAVNRWDLHPSALVHKKIAESLGKYVLDNYLK